MFKTLIVAFSTAGLAVPALAASISSSAIQVSNGGVQAFGVATSATHSVPNAALCIGCTFGPGLNQVVVNVGGTPTNLNSLTVVSPAVATGSGLGASIDATLASGSLQVLVHYEIVNNPSTGAGADTLKAVYTLRNTGASTLSVGLRVFMEVAANFNDGQNTAVSAGGPVLAANTLWTQSGGGMPSAFWVFDNPATPASSSVVAKGHLHSNALGEAATQPDAFEIANWAPISGSTHWATSAGGSVGDSGTAHWYTGSGTAAGLKALGPGTDWRIVFYYGLNQTGPAVTPTETPTRTASLTLTPSPSITDTPTASPTPTETPTRTQSATLTVSPTVTPTFTITPTFTATPRPLTLSLRPPSPHPAGPGGVWLPYYLNTASTVDIDIWTVAGERVRHLEPGSCQEGVREDFWDLRNEAGVSVASGVYIYRVRARSPADERREEYGKVAVRY